MMETNKLLISINQKIGQAEKGHDDAYLRDLITDDFQFRRANKTIVRKDDYLQQLLKMTYEQMETDVRDIVFLDNDKACVFARVKTQGLRPDKTAFSGEFENVRFFRRSADDWLLYAWYNDIVAPPEPAPSSTQEPASKPGPANWFSGKVILQKLAETPPPDAEKWQQVFFHPGARTHWHIHMGPQALHILSGTAMIGINENGKIKVTKLAAGQHVHFPSGLLHFHGAATDTFMVHMAYNQHTLPGETTYWFEKVIDNEYEITS